MSIRHIVTVIALCTTTALIIYPLSLVKAVDKNLSVTATVAASANDFQTSTARLTSGTSFSQNKEIIYEITYGSTLSTSVNFDLVATWSEGTISGTSSTVNIVDYVTSSATNGYGDVTPVIDLVNKKVTWSFTSFPASLTGQTVRFTLKTNSAYTGDSSLSFTTSSRIVGPGATTDYSTVSTSYRYSSTITSTPTPGPSATPTASPTATNTSTPTRDSAVKPTIKGITINEVSEDHISLSMTTDIPTKTSLQYGLTMKNLTTILSIPDFQISHDFVLSDLLANTTYYFRIKATSENGLGTLSDYYILHTPPVGTIKNITADQVLIHWDQVPLTAPGMNSVLTILNSPLAITLHLPAEVPISSIHGYFVSQEVLGISTESTAPHTTETNFIEIVPGSYVGELLTPTNPGVYKIYIRIVDTNGGLKQLALPYQIKNTSPITVLDDKTGKSIEHARVTIKKFDEKSGRYNDLDKAIVLPHFTDEKGVLPLMLPFGKYHLEAYASGYLGKKIMFTIETTTKSYPQIRLTPQPSLLMGVIFTREAFTDVSAFLGLSNKNILTSYRGRTVLFVANIFLFIILISTTLFLGHRIKPGHPDDHKHFWKWFISISSLALTDILLLLSLLLGILFVFQQDVIRGLIILVIAAINSTIWIQFVREIWKQEHDL